ncbi:cell envelope integrity protein CreD [Ilyomonas limi]|uniref:Cell envelope integrity protein CreD n=1 Tax=Ilyomonas limi TaxID=2575867 RepID=A0A4U3L978_9BACT|nr:cell envelope integrity protein CreD [Ilyomonas limi]TKK71935.1 cell envelope integrity protein CreD [Ilyomonas limi]
MNTTKYTDSNIATRLWLSTAAVFAAGAFIYSLFNGELQVAVIFITLGFVVACAGSLPAYLVLYKVVKPIMQRTISLQQKFTLLAVTCFLITLGYAFLPACSELNAYNNSYNWQQFFEALGAISGVLFAASIAAIYLNRKAISSYFSQDIYTSPPTYSSIQPNTINMEQYGQTVLETKPTAQSVQNKILIKAGVTAALILLMLIPVSFIQNLITERQKRQETIVKEVSSKWASAQTITTPYIVIPYYTDSISENSKRNLILLPDNLNVKSNVLPVERARSIYNVLLYRSGIDISGNFHFSLPKEIDAAKLLLSEAQLCVGISDFKGIEQQVTARVGNTDVVMTPGLPVSLDTNGLAAPLALNAGDLASNTPFSMSLHIKGSKQLHFIPLSTNSNFEVASPWQNPSFDGSVIPVDKNAGNNNTGFNARWSFNSANLPFTNVLLGKAIKPYDDLAFGVSLVQPADQYAKTMRSVKYAILIIGLTFALFFIIELLQRQPVHPVQYVLVGLALVIFYSLLVSISEFILFSHAYFIAASATVVLIALYTKSHFKSWKTAGIFFGILAGLYAFIYVLISLEDTALLVGSIALFVVLAIVMYASRKINWYRPALVQDSNQLTAPAV